MLRLLVRPDHAFRSIVDITPEFLLSIGVGFLIVDVDGTIRGELSNVPEPTIDNKLREYVDCGIKICLLSNSLLGLLVPRIKGIAENIGAEYHCCCWPNPTKPWPNVFQRAMQKIGGTQAKTAVIGDSLFTDILGGNLCKLTTIKVDTIDPIPIQEAPNRLWQHIKHRQNAHKPSAPKT